MTLFRSVITVMLFCFYFKLSNGQSCVDIVNVTQMGEESSPSNRQVIIPRSNFSCNGRITGYLISLEIAGMSDNYPILQVWHPTSSTEYTRVDAECPLNDTDISMNTDDMGNIYYFGNVSCTGNNSIKFQSGDIIGYHQSDPLHYRVWSIVTSGYTAYYRDVSTPLTTFNINNADGTTNNRQPLIQVMYDIQCDNLSTPANGEMTSCSSGTIGVSYEGDTCSFTCNTGYELTGSDTRTCQSDGSWSGSDDVCGIVMSTAATSVVSTAMTSLVPTTVTSVLPSTVIFSSIPDNNDNSTDSVAIIGGAVAGVILLLMIIVVLCIVILCMRRSSRKRGSDVVDNTAKLNTDVTIENNTTHNVTKVDHIYSTIEPFVPITTNPSYNVHTKPYSKTSEDEYNYVQPNAFIQHSTDLDQTIKMDTNPSYGISTGEDKTTALGRTITASDTNSHQSSPNSAVNQYDDDNTNVDQSCNAITNESPYLTLRANTAGLTGDDVISP